MDGERNILRRTSGRSFFGIGTTGVVAALLLGSPLPQLTHIDCAITFHPGSVERGAKPVELETSLSQDVERVHDVVFEEGSGLDGFVVVDRPFNVVVDPTDAEVGSWTVEFLEGEAVVCLGMLHVGGAPGEDEPEEDTDYPESDEPISVNASAGTATAQVTTRSPLGRSGSS